MGDWHDFFLAQARAARALTGLVFVGVSINLEKILSEPAFGLAGRAAEALILLVAVLTASVLLLVPGQGGWEASSGWRRLWSSSILVALFDAWVLLIEINR
jgi:hypothetical protein